MSKDGKKHSSDNKPSGDNVRSRRELLAATAKLSAFIGAMGLAGAGLSGEAAAERMHKTFPKVETKRKGLLLPAVQKRELKAVLQESLRTGNPRAALKRHPDLKLSKEQEAALTRITKREWNALRSAQAKMAAFGDQVAAGDTGYVFW